MSDEAVEHRRSLIKKKKQGQEEQLTSEEPILTPEQEELISEILAAHRKTFDVTFSSFNQFRPINRSSSLSMETNEPSLSLSTEAYGSVSDNCDKSDTLVQRTNLEKLSLTCHHNNNAREKDKTKNSAGQDCQHNHTDSVFSMLPHVADLSTYMIKGIINFAKQIHLFRSLTIEDQIALLKGATFELCQIRFNTVFNKTTGIWECGHLTYSMDDAAGAGFQRILLDPLLKFHYMLRDLELHDEEYVLMQAISLFSPDRPGVTEHQMVDKIQEELAIILKMYVDTKHTTPAKKFLFPRIMWILTELRTMNAEYTKQVLQIQDIQPDVTPLMMELFSMPGE
ncbi:nuclear receptor subfamily 1 group I member 2 isoform X2 [Protopterus annectens]|nr:nuclear receptor subfamily 1 group I member 2 isoform X2 [Protopterus annectens]